MTDAVDRLELMLDKALEQAKSGDMENVLLFLEEGLKSAESLPKKQNA